jgi:cell fate (sporulation/competence/biofilm development) regulator YlbF (YheA/YmcA/DUF963 family)
VCSSDLAPAPTAEAAPTPEPPAPTVAALPDDALVEVIVDGTPTQMPWKEARRSISAHAASTQRFQSAAEMRKEAEALRARADEDMQRVAAVAAQYQQLLSDPNKIAALYMAQKEAKTGTPVAQQAAPDAATLDQFAQQVLSRADSLVEQKLVQMQQRQIATQLEGDITSYTNALLKSHPALEEFPEVAERIFKTVVSKAPTNVAQAKEWIAEEVDALKARLDSKLNAGQKAAAVARAKAATATERGGSPVTAPPAVPNVFGDDFERAILDHMNARENAR